jgi:chitosanase
MRRLLAILGLATLLVAGSAHAAANLTTKQRNIADQLISLFENSTTEIQYCYIENIKDGRGYTAGRAGFTSATSDMLEVVERYTRAVPGNPLARYLPRLRVLTRRESGSTAGLEGLPDAWRQTCQDPRQRAAQDSLVDDWYYRPALRKARRVGLKLPLSIAQIYDAEIQHGGGTDPDGTPAMIRRTNKRAGGTPKRRQVSEKRWLKTFLKVRRATLRNPANRDTRAAWRESVSRVDVFSYLVRTGQWRLRAPVKVRTRDYNNTLR